MNYRWPAVYVFICVCRMAEPLFKFPQSTYRNGFLINLEEEESKANASEKADDMRAISKIEMKCRGRRRSSC